MSTMSQGDQVAYDCLVSHLNDPMFVVTASSDRERAGCLVGFVSPCSLHPPRWYVGISKLNHTFGVVISASQVVVHALGIGNSSLAMLFGEQTGDEIDKFERCRWAPGPDGRTPILSDCPRWFVGEVVDRFDPGDHLGLILAPVAARCQDHGPQLAITDLPNLEPGHPA